MLIYLLLIALIIAYTPFFFSIAVTKDCIGGVRAVLSSLQGFGIVLHVMSDSSQRCLYSPDLDFHSPSRILEDLYEPVADDDEVVPSTPFHPYENTIVGYDPNNSTEADGVDPILKETGAAINNYQFMVGLAKDEALPAPTLERIHESTARMETAPLDLPLSSTHEFDRLSPERTQNLLEKFKHSFAFGKSFVLDLVENKSFVRRPKKRAFDNEDFYYVLPIPYTESCVSRNDLQFDSVDLAEYWMSVRSSALYDNVLVGIRIMFFAVLPIYILVNNSHTKGWFLAGQLIPAFAASTVMPNFGHQCMMTVMMFQVFLMQLAWGSVMYAIHLVEHSLACWFAIFAYCFLVGLCGDLPVKRLLMVYGVLMMEYQWQAKPKNNPMFPVKFARDFFFSGVCAQIAAFFPYPIFAFRLANKRMNVLHSLYSAGIGNAMKSYWAPVVIDAETARNQIPWARMREQTDLVKDVMRFIPYEPIEFGLKNIFRQERLDHLGKVRWCLYSLSAASRLHNEEKQTSLSTPGSRELRETQKRIQELALRLSAETMRVMSALGSAFLPEEVREIDFGVLAELSTALGDLINSERDRTLLSKKLSATETNHLLRMFAFHSTFLNITGVLLSIESWAVNFSGRKYQRFSTRIMYFFFRDFWRDFYTELPKRVFLSTPRDVRIVKDAIKYSLGLMAAVGFTHGTAYGEKHVYYFGFAILARIAQQTASETLQVGIMRMCGLALGAAFAYVNVNLTDSDILSIVIMMVLGFLCCCGGQHPTYGQVGQYAVTITIAGIALVRDSPEKLLNRISANVFAFTSYLIVCLVVFPVDPIRVMSNYRTKCLQRANDLTQSLVVLGCCPVTKTRDEAKYYLTGAEEILVEQHENLIQAQQWRAKAAVEPTVRGDVFPDRAFGMLYLYLAEFVSLQEGLLQSMKSLHRPRTVEPSLMICEILELIRPFLIDAGKLIQRYFQLLIDSSEQPFEWSLEKTTETLWKVQLSLLSLKRLTGNIQQNFISALMQQKGLGRRVLNQYMDPVAMEAALQCDHLDNFSFQGSFSQMMNSFKAVILNSALDHEDMCVFETIVVNFTLLMTTMTSCLESVIDIHSYEQSRRL
eukprot:gene13272-9114_t